MHPLIYILLPVFNRKFITDRFLNQLKAQTYKNTQILILNDGSTDGTPELVANNHPECRIFNAQDLWWAGSLQYLIDQLRKEKPNPDSIVLIANDDVEIPSDYLESAVNLLNGKRNVLLGSVLKTSADSATDEYGVIFDLKTCGMRAGKAGETVNCLPTRGLFLRWGDFAKTGEFYPRLLPHYFSDYEFSIRAFQNSFQLLLDPKVWVRADDHKSGKVLAPGAGLRPTLKHIFSNLNHANPIHYSIFVFLRSPWPYNFLNQWIAVKMVYSDLKIGLKPWQFFPIQLLIVVPWESARWLKKLPRRILGKIRRVFTRRPDSLQ